MITTEKKNNTFIEEIRFDSLSEFYDYLCKTEYNNAFVNRNKVSGIEGFERYKFTGTMTFNDAVNLMKNGWKDMSKELTQKLKVFEKGMETATRRKQIYSVAGYQACVPRYLQGIPENMIATKNVPMKNKVITLVKSINYSANVKTKEIIEESVKAMAIVKKLESEGYRVNLDLMLGAKQRYKFACRIRLKSANERLNVSKLAFPLVHPSMLRRLYFRFIEVYPHITSDFVGNYGYPLDVFEMKSILDKTDYLIPSVIYKDLKNITGIEDLIK